MASYHIFGSFLLLYEASRQRAPCNSNRKTYLYQLIDLGITLGTCWIPMKDGSSGGPISNRRGLESAPSSDTDVFKRGLWELKGQKMT